MDITERLLNTKVVILLGFLWFVVEFLRSDYLGYSIRWKKCSKTELFAWKSVTPTLFGSFSMYRFPYALY